MTARRKDDVVVKWILGIVASMAVLFVAEFIMGLKSSARIEEQVRTNTASINELKDFKLKLIRIEVMTEIAINKLNDMSALVKVTREEQLNRSPVIEEAKKHLRKHR